MPLAWPEVPPPAATLKSRLPAPPCRLHQDASMKLPAAGACLLAAMASACGSSGDVRAPDLPPVPAAVRDGAGRDIDKQDSLSAVFANWDPFVDPDGRAVTYEWSLGTMPGAQDVMHWTY